MANIIEYENLKEFKEVKARMPFGSERKTNVL